MYKYLDKYLQIFNINEICQLNNRFSMYKIESIVMILRKLFSTTYVVGLSDIGRGLKFLIIFSFFIVKLFYYLNKILVLASIDCLTNLTFLQ